ncbi:MAG: NUDIX domain-containing protein [Spirochaetaceae bacterium]
MFEYCPSCGSKGLGFHQDKLLKCPSCDFEMYLNIAASTAGILFFQSKLVVLRRNREPGKGLLDLPGGFVDPEESSEDCMKRECLEELGVKIDSLEYLVSFPNKYLFKDINYNTCDLFFIGQLSGKPKLNDPEENSELILLDIESINLKDFAFPSMHKGLNYYLKKYQ